MDLIDSLLHYVQEIKPFHTKVYGVDVEYRAYDDVNISITEQLHTWTYAGIPFRDLTDYEYGVNGYPYDAGPNFETSPSFRDIFDLQVGWDSIGFDSSEGWDSNNTTHLQLANPNKGLLLDNVLIHFDERLEVEFDRQKIDDIVDIPYVIYRSWDAMDEGLDIQSISGSTVTIGGDYTKVLGVGDNQIGEVEIRNSDTNNGTYSVLQAIYNTEHDHTSITLSFPLNDSDSTGMVLFGLWDSGLGWDGWTAYSNIPRPNADIYSQTQVAEQVRLAVNYGWDDSNVQGWDNDQSLFRWDDGELILDHMSHKFDTPGWENNDRPWQAVAPEDALDGIDVEDGETHGFVYEQPTYEVDSQGIYYKPNSTGKIAFSPTRIPSPYTLPPEPTITQPLSNEWTELSIYPGTENRTSGGLAILDDKVYMYGGFGSSSPTLWRYDLQSNQWTQMASGGPNTHNIEMVTYDNKIYVFGGGNFSDELHEYDPELDIWSQKQSCPVTFSNHINEVIDGSLYVYGGLGSSERQTWKYTFTNDQWTRLADGPPHRHHMVSCSVGHMMYIFGGSVPSEGTVPSNELWRYNTVTNLWQLESIAPSRRQQHFAACYGGKLHVIGGYDNITIEQPNIMTYDFETKIWGYINGSNLNIPQNPAHFNYNNKVYVFGGSISDPGFPDDGRTLWVIE